VKPRILPDDLTLLEMSKTMYDREIADIYGVTRSVATAALRRARINAGLTPLHKHRRHDVPSPRELLKLDREMTRQELADKLALTTTALSHHICKAKRKLGLPVPRPGGYNQRRTNAPPFDELDDALRRWGIAGTADEYDVDEAQVALWMREHNI